MDRIPAQSFADQLKELVENGNMLKAQGFVIANRVALEYDETTYSATSIFSDGSQATQFVDGSWA